MDSNIFPPLVAGAMVAVFGSRRQSSHASGLRMLFSALHEAGFRLCFENRFGTYLLDNGIFPHSGAEISEVFPTDASLVISIGGDGTMLRSARWSFGHNVPVVGINTGHLGFLTSYTLEECGKLVADVTSPEGIAVERRSVLELRCGCETSRISPFALNEVALMKDETSSMISVNVDVDGEFLADYLVDGLVVSTPTGSTAYNLSVGGPILMPALDCMVISPVAPHTLTLRPVVIPGDAAVRCKVSSRSGSCRVSLDGNSFVVKEGTTVEIVRASDTVPVMRRPGGNFAATLREKLYWGRR